MVVSLQPLHGYMNFSTFCPSTQPNRLSQILATLLFLSYRYNEQLPVG
jgi:hypothetical protein